MKGLEMFIVFNDCDDVCLYDIESNLPLFEGEDKEPEEAEMSMLLGFSFFVRLVFRPNEAKNPPLFNEMDGDGARERIEGEGPMLELDRDGLVRGGFIARDGYGRVRDTEVGDISS
jgi:hypothetical protein